MGKKGEEARQRIIHEFDRYIRVSGYKNATIPRLSEACGMSCGHIYFYFPKKEELLKETVRNFFIHTQQVLNSHIPLPEDEMLRFFMHYLFTCYITGRSHAMNRLVAELSGYVTIIDQRAVQMYQEAIPLLQAFGDSDSVYAGCAGATYLRYTMTRAWRINRQPYCYEIMFNMLLRALFAQLSFPEAEHYRTEALDRFDRADKNAMMAHLHTCHGFVGYPEELEKTPLAGFYGAK